MLVKQFSVEINRPIEEVFEYVSDPENLPKWGEGIVRVKMISEDKVGAGAKYTIINKIGGREREFVNTVQDYETNSKFSYETESYFATRTFKIVENGTQVTEKIEKEGKGLRKVTSWLLLTIAGRMHKKSLENLKTILEK